MCCKPVWSLELYPGLKSWAKRIPALHPEGIWDSRLELELEPAVHRALRQTRKPQTGWSSCKGNVK